MYFIFGYVYTASVVSVAQSKNAPVVATLDFDAAAADTGDAVAGQAYLNACDGSNGNSFTYNAKKVLVVINTHATDSLSVTVNTKDDTLLGLARTNPDVVKVVAAGEVAIFPLLTNSFNDSNVVKVDWAESGGSGAVAASFHAILELS